MDDIDRLSKHVPHICKVAPSTAIFHMEDVHRAGGVMGILGELDRAGLIHTNTHTCLGLTLGEQLNKFDIARNPSDEVVNLYKAAPGGQVTLEPFSQIM